MKEYRIPSVDSLDEVVRDVLSSASSSGGAFCIALHGDLGAGKTTFTQRLAKQLGVSEVVTSPTFVVMRVYDVLHDRFDRLVHIDAYRIESDIELNPLHFDEIVHDSRTILCIEWPEHVRGRLPERMTHVTLHILPDETRNVTISSEWSD